MEKKRKAALQKPSAVKNLFHPQGSPTKPWSPTKLAWAVQSPRIAPRMLQGAIQPGPLDDPSNTFITAVPAGHSVPAATIFIPGPKEFHVEPAKKTEISRNYSILTDKDVPSRALDLETEMISDCSKGSRMFVMRKWQLLKILDEFK
jgi:hypothetical protein